MPWSCWPDSVCWACGAATDRLGRHVRSTISRPWRPCSCCSLAAHWSGISALFYFKVLPPPALRLITCRMRALSMLQVVVIMEQEGIAPDVITYNSLLKAAAARGLLGDARRLYAELLQAGLAPSTFTYAALFSAAARARSSDAAWLLQVGCRGHGRMLAAECTPLGGCAADIVDSGRFWAQQKVAPGLLFSPSHSQCSVVGPACPQMFDEMQQLGVQPNNHVVSALFAAASFAPCNPAQLERLFAALALLRRWGAGHFVRAGHLLLFNQLALTPSWSCLPIPHSAALAPPTTLSTLRCSRSSSGKASRSGRWMCGARCRLTACGSAPTCSLPCLLVSRQESSPGWWLVQCRLFSSAQPLK